MEFFDESIVQIVIAIIGLFITLITVVLKAMGKSKEAKNIQNSFEYLQGKIEIYNTLVTILSNYNTMSGDEKKKVKEKLITGIAGMAKVEEEDIKAFKNAIKHLDGLLPDFQLDTWKITLKNKLSMLQTDLSSKLV